MDFIFSKGLVALLTVGAVFLFATIAFNILTQALETYQERYIAKSMTDLSDMFLFIDGRQLLILNICATALFLLIGFLFLGTFFTIIIGVLGFFLPTLLVRYFRYRRLKRFNIQLVDSLNQMANAFKAGLSFPQAMEHVGSESDPPISQEFSLFIREIKLGVSLDEALQNMADRVKCDDLDLVVTATIISRQLGGNMAEMFDTIAATIRERFRLEGKIKALTAQGKLQGWIVAALPLALGLVLNYMRPDLMEPMFDTPFGEPGWWFGWFMVGVILLSEGMGIWLIRKIVNIDV